MIAVGDTNYLDKKTAIATIIGVIVIAGAISAYSAKVLAPPPSDNSGKSGNNNGVTTTQSENNTTTSSPISKQPPTGIVITNNNNNSAIIIQDDTSAKQRQQPSTNYNNNNNTIVANNTIITINKPVYESNTLVYQPVSINIENYTNIIKQRLQIDENDKITINNNGDVIVNGAFVKPPKTDKDNNNNNGKNDGKPPSAVTYSLIIRADKIQSKDWKAKFTDDHAGMFVTVYDLQGKLIKSGYADERGITVSGLQNRLYFVYPADCLNCNNSGKDIVFKKWEDGSTERPRIIPAGSDITATYALVNRTAETTTTSSSTATTTHQKQSMPSPSQQGQHQQPLSAPANYKPEPTANASISSTVLQSLVELGSTYQNKTVQVGVSFTQPLTMQMLQNIVSSNRLDLQYIEYALDYGNGSKVTTGLASDKNQNSGDLLKLVIQQNQERHNATFDGITFMAANGTASDYIYLITSKTTLIKDVQIFRQIGGGNILNGNALAKKLESSQNLLTQMIVDNKNAVKGENYLLPPSTISIDKHLWVLTVGIDDTKATLSKEVYIQKLKNLLGQDVPIRVEFTHMGR